jgi:hypothetical protein
VHEAEPVEDSLAAPIVPEAEIFVVETEPVIEEIEQGAADGGSVEDATAEPTIPDISQRSESKADERPEDMKIEDDRPEEKEEEQ